MLGRLENDSLQRLTDWTGTEEWFINNNSYFIIRRVKGKRFRFLKSCTLMWNQTICYFSPGFLTAFPQPAYTPSATYLSSRTSTVLRWVISCHWVWCRDVPPYLYWRAGWQFPVALRNAGKIETKSRIAVPGRHSFPCHSQHLALFLTSAGASSGTEPSMIAGTLI